MTTVANEGREALAIALEQVLLTTYSNAEKYAGEVLERLSGFRLQGPITDDQVAAALDARAGMSRVHCYLYSTEKCRCGAEWSDAHWMRYVLEAARDAS